MANKLTITTPTERGLVMTRGFDAPRRLVWDAMTRPDLIRRWLCCPPGWTMTVCECDARVAGALRLVWGSREAEPAMALHGVFTEVVEHERMVHTETMLLGSGQPIGSQVETHEFEERSGVTTVRITQVYASKEARDAALASGMEQGVGAGYDNLDRMLAAE